MYKIYIGDKLLYHPNIEEKKLLYAKVSQELNKKGSFTFTMLPSHPCYDEAVKMQSIICIYDENYRIFRGRVLDSYKDFYMRKKCVCEGEMCFLSDSMLRPYEYKGSVEGYFRLLIESHNSQVDEPRRFKIGRVTVTDPNDYITRSDSTYPSTWDTIQDKLIDRLGGYLWTREEEDGIYIDYLEDFDTLNSQTIEFAKNLLDFDETIKGQDIATAIIPLGCRLEDEEGNQTEERLNIKEVNGGIDYVCNEEAVKKYGLIYRPVIWDDVTLPENLLRKGREELQTSINLIQTIELSALDLHNLNRDIRSFHLGSYTKVISKPHNLEETLLTRKRETNLLDPTEGKLSLGDERQTFTDKQAETNKKTDQAVQIIESIKSDYQINKDKVQNQIANIANSLEMELSCNSTLYQKKLKTGGLDPDYTKTPLILAPTVKFKGTAVDKNLTYVWKRKIKDAAETALVSGETVSNGVLTVKRNIDEGLVRYICYVTYTVSPTERYIANAYLDFAQLEDGQNGEAGKPGDPGKDAAIISDTEPEDKTRLWCDTSVDPPVLKRWDGEQWQIVGDISEAVNAIYKNVYSAIEQSASDILIKVGEDVYIKKEIDQLLSSISTEYQQTKNSFEFKFKQFMQDLADVANGTDAKFTDISKYIRFIDGNIELGQVGDPILCRIKNNRFSFLENNVEIAYIADRKLYITDGEFINSLKIGNFAFIPRKNGNLSFKKVR